jgi:hypothetical protein
VNVSDADFDHFPQQVMDAAGFLRDNAEQLWQLCKWPGIECVTLDFGIHLRDTWIHCDYLPPELGPVRRIGSCHYPEAALHALLACSVAAGPLLASPRVAQKADPEEQAALSDSAQGF